MGKNKTVETTASVAKFLDSIEHNTKRKDAKRINKIFQEVTGLKPKIWGESIVGFGKYNYTTKSGSEEEMALTGFSPRKQNMTLYLSPGSIDYGDLLEKLGNHKTSKACLYFTRLDKIDEKILKQLIAINWEVVNKKHK